MPLSHLYAFLGPYMGKIPIVNTQIGLYSTEHLPSHREMILQVRVRVRVRVCARLSSVESVPMPVVPAAYTCAAAAACHAGSNALF